MTKMRQALFTQLEWQLQQLTQQLCSLEQQLTRLDSAIQSCDQAISTSSTIPLSIMPEQEMARIFFVSNQQQKRATLHAEKVSLLDQKASLLALKIQRNINLKRLEKHQERLLKNEHRQMICTQQNERDEWIIQQRPQQQDKYEH